VRNIGNGTHVFCSLQAQVFILFSFVRLGSTCGPRPSGKESESIARLNRLCGRESFHLDGFDSHRCSLPGDYEAPLCVAKFLSHLTAYGTQQSLIWFIKCTVPHSHYLVTDPHPNTAAPLFLVLGNVKSVPKVASFVIPSGCQRLANGEHFLSHSLCDIK
jgi:hypothetical protein